MKNILPVSTKTDWHAIRAKHVGGSEISALFNLSPYMTRFELWHVKKGTIPADDLSGNERVQAGNFMEPAIAAWASEKWGVPLEKFQGYAVHDSVIGMGCTPDFVNNGKDLIVQIKNVDSLQFNREWDAEGDTITKAPLHILLQVQHELACTRAGSAWLVACVGGNKLFRMEIEPRQATIAKLESDVAAFWASIYDGIEPKADFNQDAGVISAIHSFADPVKEIDLTANNRAHELCAAYEDAASREKSAAKERAEAKAELLTLLGDAGRATVGAYLIKANSVSDSKGKIILPEMVGTMIGARKGYRNLSITNQEDAT